nr:Type IV pilus assembly PilZ, probable fragment [uncultured bacterium]
MAEQPAALESHVIDVPLWWRRLSAVEFSAVVRARRVSAVPLSMHPGLEGEVRGVLAAEQAAFSGERLASIAGQRRLVVLEGFNAKLNRVMERVGPGDDLLQPHPLQLHESGEGLTFWVREGDVGVGDLLELRFSLFVEQPMAMHAYCRVRRVRREWSGSGLRVDCGFESLPGLEASVASVSVPEVSAAVSQEEQVEVSLPPEPSLWEPGEADVWVSEPREPVVVASSPLPSLPMPGIEERRARLDRKLSEGMEMVATDPRVVAARLVEQSGFREPTGPKRQDYRLNDNLPLAWKVLSRKSFDQAVVYFNSYRDFPLRERVVRQKRLLAEADVQLKLLRQLNVKARRPVVWFREQLDYWFRQANSENEEEFCQGVMMIFFNLLKELTKRPPGSMLAAQVVSLLKDQVELQMARDRLGPGAQKMVRGKAEEDLATVKRQIGKLLDSLRVSSPVLGERLQGFLDVVGMMDLTRQDIPRQLTAEGDAVFTVNLSATGVAWRTLKDRVYKGDLVEVRLGLDPDARGVWETVWAYGRVVVVQEPDEQGKSRVACFFEHMAPLQREKLQAHIVRRQREELVRRATA